MKVVLPDNIPGFRAPEVPGIEWVWADPARMIPAEHEDAEVWVSWMNPPELLADAARRLRRLRLVQSFSAGVESIVAAGFDPEVQIASGVGLHDRTVAEHGLALLLALVRSVPESVRAQQAHRWEQAERIAWQADPANGLSSLHGARVLIWGFGSIGRALAPLLGAFGAEVQGAARSAGLRHGVPVVDEAGLDAALAAADAVVLVLPGGEATRHALDARRLALLRPSALVVNVGRGTVIDPEALRAALEAGRLAGAALDVTEPEPLPADSPLWDAPGLLITPHHGGGRPIGAAALLERNVRALREGTALENLVDR